MNPIIKLILPEVLQEVQDSLLLTDEYPKELFEALEVKVIEVLAKNPHLVWELMRKAHTLVCEELNIPKEASPYAPLPVPLEEEAIKNQIKEWIE